MLPCAGRRLYAYNLRIRYSQVKLASKLSLQLQISTARALLTFVPVNAEPGYTGLLYNTGRRCAESGTSTSDCR